MGKSKDVQNLNAPGPGQYNQDDSIVKKSSARVGIPGAKRAENLPGVGTGDDPDLGTSHLQMTAAGIMEYRSQERTDSSLQRQARMGKTLDLDQAPTTPET